MAEVTYKLRTILAVVFAVFLVVLIAEVAYILCRRRRFIIRERPTADVELGQEQEEDGSKLPPPPSKELLYFLCWKGQTMRVEPADHSYAERGTAPPLPLPCTEAGEEDDDDVLEKWKKEQVLLGPSRVLFTITEEERESAFSEDDVVLGSKVKNGLKKVVVLGRSRSGSIEEVEVEFDVDADLSDLDLDDMTPFWTPCASPAYYTPSPSPSRDENSSRKMGPTDHIVPRPV